MPSSSFCASSQTLFLPGATATVRLCWKRVLPCRAWLAVPCNICALRGMESDHGWIRILLEEAENERMHLMTFIHVAQPTHLERLLILLVQGVFYNLFFLLYVISAKTAHRVVGYLEEEAVYSYTEYLAGVDNGTYANVPAPQIAIDYWQLAADARLRDVIIAIRADAAHHRDVNHEFADKLASLEKS